MRPGGRNPSSQVFGFWFTHRGGGGGCRKGQANREQLLLEGVGGKPRPSSIACIASNQLVERYYLIVHSHGCHLPDDLHRMGRANILPSVARSIACRSDPSDLATAKRL